MVKIVVWETVILREKKHETNGGHSTNYHAL